MIKADYQTTLKTKKKSKKMKNFQRTNTLMLTIIQGVRPIILTGNLNQIGQQNFLFLTKETVVAKLTK
jgi:hypothetical protein